jgi:hypothetical protein
VELVYIAILDTATDEGRDVGMIRQMSAIVLVKRVTRRFIEVSNAARTRDNQRLSIRMLHAWDWDTAWVRGASR